MATIPTNRPQYEFWRTGVVYAAFLLILSILISQLFRLQVIEGADWAEQALENRKRDISVPPQRGIIYDRNQYILARNVASYNITITPAYLPDDEADIQEIYRQLSLLTEVPVNNGTVEDAKNFADCVPGPGIAQLVELGDSLAPYNPVRIDCNVDEDLARIVREKAVGWPGVSVQIEPVRDYPTGILTSNIIGFLGPIPESQRTFYEDLGFVTQRDKIGYSGVEAYFQDILAGVPGKRVIEVDVAGQELRNLESPLEQQPGDNLYLTIDTRLQKAAEGAVLDGVDSLNRFLGRIQISSAAAIAMNPKTGEILAMVSYPSFENNRLARFIPLYYYEQISQDPRHPLLNNTVQTEYAPGSVFKLVTAVGVLNEGIVTPETVIEAPGQLLVTERFSPNDPSPGFERPFRDWIYDTNPEGFGRIDFLHCIAYSSNVCFYKLGGGWEDEIEEGLDIERIKEYAKALGYDQTSGIEMLGEADGLIPDPTWKRINQGENWSRGDTYIATVGQGYVLATPLQVLMSAATIINDGKLIQPTLVKQIEDSDGNVLTRWLNSDGTITALPTDVNSRQISPFTPHQKWDSTVDPIITDFACEDEYCDETGIMKTIQPWIFGKIREGMRMAVTDSRGTLHRIFDDEPIAYAGKTGTAEYCDDVARDKDLCKFGAWPRHAWTVAFAPYDDPEIVVIVFAYNGGEGGSVAAPIVEAIMQAYFRLKAIDLDPFGD